jgi:hypothetical protein
MTLQIDNTQASKQHSAPTEIVNQSILYCIGKTDIFMINYKTYFFCK